MEHGLDLTGNPTLWGPRAEDVASSNLQLAPGVLAWEGWGRVHLLIPPEGLLNASKIKILEKILETLPELFTR